MTSQIFRCTSALFLNQNDSLKECIFDNNVYKNFDNFNQTDCISKVEHFKLDVDYICTFFYLNIYNSSDCVQFYYSGKNNFESHRCYTFDEELANLFTPSIDPIEIVFSILFLLFLFYYEGCFRTKNEV